MNSVRDSGIFADRYNVLVHVPRDTVVNDDAESWT